MAEPTAETPVETPAVEEAKPMSIADEYDKTLGEQYRGRDEVFNRWLDGMVDKMEKEVQKLKKELDKVFDENPDKMMELYDAAEARLKEAKARLDHLQALKEESRRRAEAPKKEAAVAEALKEVEEAPAKTADIEEKITENAEAEAGKDSEVGDSVGNGQELKPVERNVFGNIYNQFRGKVKEALSFIMQVRGGYLEGVFSREGFGDIDLAWGEGNAGFVHILDKHVGPGKSFATAEEAIDAIDNIIKNGELVKEDGGKASFMIGSQKVVVRKNIKDGRIKKADKNWVLTAYDENSADNETGATSVANRAQAALSTESVDKVNTSSPEKQEAGPESSDQERNPHVTDGKERKKNLDADPLAELDGRETYVEQERKKAEPKLAESERRSDEALGEAKGMKFIETTNKGEIKTGAAAGLTWASVYGNDGIPSGLTMEQAIDRAWREKYKNAEKSKKAGVARNAALHGVDVLSEQKLAIATEGGKEPTEAQKKAGNYKMEHRRIDGFEISIENAKGSIRSGKDADGTEWRTRMHNDYGYIRGTKGADGDHVDVFLSDNPEQGDVYVIDQLKKDGSFDEHKVMYGFTSAQEAMHAYLANYDEGWTGLGSVTKVSKEQFKEWCQAKSRKKMFTNYGIGDLVFKNG